MIFFRIFVGVITFTAAAWGVNKALKATTGRDIDENLDLASDKVLEFVGYKDPVDETTTTTTTTSTESTTEEPKQIVEVKTERRRI